MLQVSILSTALVALVALFAVAQAQFFRPFPLAMNAFSAYHPGKLGKKLVPPLIELFSSNQPGDTAD